MALSLAVLVSLVCIALSARQLWTVVCTPSSDALTLVKLCREEPSQAPRALLLFGEFEQRLAEALLFKGARRNAEIHEVLLELEFAYKKGARTPALCTRIASSAGFLCSTVYLRRALSEVADNDVPAFDGVLMACVNVVSIGVAGAIVCAAIHRLALGQMKERLAEMALLGEHLDRLAPTA
jgi:hypothetical protein